MPDGRRTSVNAVKRLLLAQERLWVAPLIVFILAACTGPGNGEASADGNHFLKTDRHTNYDNEGAHNGTYACLTRDT